MNIKMRNLIFIIFMFLCSCNFEDTAKIKKLEKNLAYASVRIEKYAETVEAADELLKYKPYNGWAYYERGLALSRLKRKNEAIESFNKAIKYYKNAPESKQSMVLNGSYYNRGIIQEHTGRLEEAVVSYEMAIKHGYEHRSVFHYRDSTLMKLGRIYEY